MHAGCVFWVAVAKNCISTAGVINWFKFKPQPPLRLSLLYYSEMVRFVGDDIFWWSTSTSILGRSVIKLFKLGVFCAIGQWL